MQDAGKVFLASIKEDGDEDRRIELN